jgi:hypothetical protein
MNNTEAQHILTYGLSKEHLWSCVKQNLQQANMDKNQNGRLTLFKPCRIEFNKHLIHDLHNVSHFKIILIDVINI